jgi:hypothetical protein
MAWMKETSRSNDQHLKQDIRALLKFIEVTLEVEDIK